MAFVDFFDKIIWKGYAGCMEQKASEIARAAGLSEKAARAYASVLDLGQATIAEIASLSKVKRTTLYSLLAELEDSGALYEVRIGKRTYWRAIEPSELLKLAQERLWEAGMQPVRAQSAKKLPSLPYFSFFSGPAGFKQIWNMLFKSKEKEFRIITDGAGFLDFARERYIVEEIIGTKKKLGIRSKQLILDGAYARKIVAKDSVENRVSKLLPREHGRLPFTEIICKEFVAFISPRFDNALFLVENEQFAQTRHTVFEALWKNLR